MSVKLIALLAAATAGVFMALQGALNARLSKAVGLLEATFFVHAIGIIFILVLFFFGLGKGSFAKYAEAPWYVYIGGVLGVAIIYGVVRAIPQVGVAPATTAIIIAQVSTAAFIDHFGLFGLQQMEFTWLKGLGLILLAAGGYVLLRN